MLSRRLCSIALGLPIAGLNVTHAQQATPPLMPDQDQPAADQGSPWTSILAGSGLGLVGFVVGGFSGAAMAQDCTGDEFCELEAAFLGAAAGGAFGMALGVHLGNQRRGNLALDFLTGAAIWGAGIGIAVASGWDAQVTRVALVTIPLAQLAGTVVVERAIGRSRLRRQRVSVAIEPRVSGGVRLSARVAL